MGNKLLRLLLVVIVVGLCYWILTWGLGAIGLPSPFDRFAHVILVIAAVLFIVDALLGVVDKGFLKWP